MKKVISEQLKRLGIPANLLGYEYLREAVAMAIADKNYIRQINKGFISRFGGEVQNIGVKSGKGHKARD